MRLFRGLDPAGTGRKPEAAFYADAIMQTSRGSANGERRTADMEKIREELSTAAGGRGTGAASTLLTAQSLSSLAAPH